MGCGALGSVTKELVNELDYCRLDRVSDVRSCGTIAHIS
jgi:hypothetical protein